MVMYLPMAFFSIFKNSYPLYGSQDPVSRSYRSFPTRMLSVSLFAILGLAALLFVAFGIVLILEILWYRRHKIRQDGIQSPIQSLVLRYLGYWVATTLIIGLGGNVVIYLIAFTFGGVHL